MRLLVPKTAWLMDTAGKGGAHTGIQAITIATPLADQRVVDRAIQAHGAAGVSPGHPGWPNSGRAYGGCAWPTGPTRSASADGPRRELREYGI